MLDGAIRLYTGYGNAAFPQANADRVRSEYPPADAEAALQRIGVLMTEIQALQPDWQSQALSAASLWAEGEMRIRHPELNEASLSALSWSFSYLWK